MTKKTLSKIFRHHIKKSLSKYHEVIKTSDCHITTKESEQIVLDAERFFRKFDRFFPLKIYPYFFPIYVRRYKF